MSVIREGVSVIYHKEMFDETDQASSRIGDESHGLSRRGGLLSGEGLSGVVADRGLLQDGMVHGWSGIIPVNIITRIEYNHEYQQVTAPEVYSIRFV